MTALKIPLPVPVAFPVKQGLQILNIGRTKFYEEVQAGRIKVVHVGRKTLIPATEMTTWLNRLSEEEATDD